MQGTGEHAIRVQYIRLDRCSRASWSPFLGSRQALPSRKITPIGLVYTPSDYISPPPPTNNLDNPLQSDESCYGFPIICTHGKGAMRNQSLILLRSGNHPSSQQTCKVDADIVHIANRRGRTTKAGIIRPWFAINKILAHLTLANEWPSTSTISDA